MFKKIFTLVAVAVLTAGYAQAQVKYGVRAGLNLSTFSGEDVEDGVSFKPGFQIGVVGDYSLNETFALQSGLLFSTQGAKHKQGNASRTYNLNYFQIPVNGQYKIDLSGRKLLLQAGPYFGYGIGGSLKQKSGSNSNSSSIKFGEGKQFDNAFEFGFGLGAGMDFNNIRAGIGYNFGLTSLFENHSFKNGGLSFTVTYFWGK